MSQSLNRLIPKSLQIVVPCWGFRSIKLTQQSFLRIIPNETKYSILFVRVDTNQGIFHSYKFTTTIYFRCKYTVVLDSSAFHHRLRNSDAMSVRAELLWLDWREMASNIFNIYIEDEVTHGLSLCRSRKRESFDDLHDSLCVSSEKTLLWGTSSFIPYDMIKTNNSW